MAAATATPAARPVVTNDEEFMRVVFEVPPAQRLAALAVARFQYTTSLKSLLKPAKEVEEAYMPLFDFVRLVPPATRDEMFRSQLDAVRYVEASPLLELVDSQGNPISASTLAQHGGDEAASGDGAAPQTPTAPTYSPLLHVRVGVKPLVVLRAMDSGHLTRKPISSSAAVSQGAGDDEEAEVRSAMVEALRGLEAKVVHRVATNLRGKPDASVAEVKRELEMPRFVPWSDVVHRVRQDIAAGGGSVSPAFNRGSLTEVLQSVLDKSGVPVQVGRQRRKERAETAESAAAPNFLPDIERYPFWVVQEKLASSSGRRVAVFVALRYPGERYAPFFQYVYPRINAATSTNAYGGWGGENIVPTREDVYEVLKYIPVNWVNYGLLELPSEVKRRHIRTASPQQWFRRQPFYFELRNLNGSIEIRRSIVLHPEAHGLTKTEAQEVLELQLATGEANKLVFLTSSGEPVANAATLLERTAVKFLLRVCPTYFAPMFLVSQRYTKKNLTEEAMLLIARKQHEDFEELRTRFSDVVLIRRRSGADSSRWRDAFVADLEQYPEDVRGIMTLCGYMCPSWDRPEYVYVALTPSEQVAIGGYAGMMRILQRHPTIFRFGKHFVCRADPSDPLALQEVEPAPDDVTARSLLRDENPYQAYESVARVFHYVAPDDAPCTVAYLADCASPAMRTVLPTRIVSIVQAFPKLFACTETSPGVFSIRKLKQRVARSIARRSAVEAAQQSGQGDATAAATATAAAAAADDAEMIHMLEEEIAEEEHLTRSEVVEAVRNLVPASGVDAEQLLVWASMPVQRAANEHFGGVVKLVEAHRSHFRVVQQEQTKMVYRL